MATKITQGFTDSWSVHVEGLWLVISYRNKEVERKNLKMFNLAHRDLEVYLGENAGREESVEIEEGAGEATVTQNEVIKFAQVFQGLQKKYTGRYATYVPPGKGSKPSTKTNWNAMTAACAQAKKNDLDAHTYLMMLIKYYSRNTKGRQNAPGMNFPFINQLHGEWAQQVIVNESARMNPKVAPEIKAERLANTNKYLAFDKDQEFIEARARCKAHKQTRFDVEYLKARTAAQFGEPKDWVLKYEKELNERERAEANE